MVSTKFRTGPYFDPMFPDATYRLFRSTTEDDKYLPIISHEAFPCKNILRLLPTFRGRKNRFFFNFTKLNSII